MDYLKKILIVPFHFLWAFLTDVKHIKLYLFLIAGILMGLGHVYISVLLIILSSFIVVGIAKLTNQDFSFDNRSERVMASIRPYSIYQVTISFAFYFIVILLLDYFY